MIRSRLALTALTLLLAACGSGTEAPTTEEWLGLGQERLHCRHKTDKVAMIENVRHDVDGDGTAEWFVTFRCEGQAAQVEVYAGDADPVESAPTETLVYNNDYDHGRELNLDAGCIYFTGKRVIIRGHQFREPKRPILRVVAWNDKDFADPQPDIVSAEEFEFPGCD